MTTAISVRIDKETKEEVEDILKDLGLNMSSAINIYFRQIIRKRAIPFKIKEEKPNWITRRAIREGERMLKTGKGKAYNSIEELRKDLGV